MQNDTENQSRRELLAEEIAQLKIFLERHLNWAQSSDETAIGDQNRMIAEMLKDVVEDNQTLIEWLKVT